MKSRKYFRVIFFLIIPILLTAYFIKARSFSSDLSQLTDPKGINIGVEKSILETTINESNYTKTVNRLNVGWENIRLGDSYKRAGKYEEAIQAYRRAYEADPGNRVFIGDVLIEAYEESFRYDEAIAMADEILKTQPLVEYGIEKFTKIRTRLLAAKAASQKSHGIANETIN